MTIVLDRIPRITTGVGALESLGTLVAGRLGTSGSVLLVADPGLMTLGLIDEARHALTRSGLAVHLFADIRSDPLATQVDAGAAIARRERVGAVVALGGGSALDAGKAIAVVAGSEAPAESYALCAKPFPKTRLLKICVPTTSGTGSETTRTSIVTDAAGNKVWLWGDELKADEVVLDPALTVGLPPALTAATGIDALVHAIEASTNRNAFAANDVFCHEAIRLVTRWLLRALEQPGDLAAREGLQRAATLAGIGIDNAGTAVAHNIGHALASLRPLHHGRAVGVAMLATLPWNVAHDPHGRWAAVAAAMGQAPEAVAVPRAFERLLRACGIEVGLARDGFADVTPEALAAQMARPENTAMRRSNAREIADEDLLAFARTVLAQS
ncbi:iron-containing alcohol dehydrogenase [Benzoatithermus flavus]|uniref:Iron-containing alcohol dehydrogenase n=1 Tax=Benzoatithermus flavus TaxID=3108223 RepID=A0ABU8XK13_9PROT